MDKSQVTFVLGTSGARGIGGTWKLVCILVTENNKFQAPLNLEPLVDPIHSPSDREKLDLVFKGSNPSSASPPSRPQPVSCTTEHPLMYTSK
jgi:hypothetical protein